jgi:SnoaL-like domain
MSEQLTAIDAFLEGVRTGEWGAMAPHYHPTAMFKGTVPRWYFTVQGRDDVVRQMGEWFPLTSDVSDLHVMTTGEGAVVEFERHWVRPAEDDSNDGEQVGVRQAHIFHLDEDGRIREQHGHCAGIWDAATFAEAEQALAQR